VTIKGLRVKQPLGNILPAILLAQQNKRVKRKQRHIISTGGRNNAGAGGVTTSHRRLMGVRGRTPDAVPILQLFSKKMYSFRHSLI